MGVWFAETTEQLSSLARVHVYSDIHKLLEALNISLRFALLALLSSTPRTGYDLLRIFDRSVAFVWHAPHTQIYPELRRMEAEGLLSSQEVPRGERGVKRSYRLTNAGLRDLERRAGTPVEPTREKDPYRLKAAYLEWTDKAAARAQLELHIAHYERWLEAWTEMAEALRARTDPILRERLAVRPADEHEAIVATKVFAYEGLIARARMEIDWARGGLELLRTTNWPGERAAD
jgi:DNA-binding PadR family transcriptional regulator